MYAYRQLVCKQHDSQPEKERYSVKVTRGGKPVAGYEPEKIAAVVEEVMYWRKANHIHAWFVANVQDGDDDQALYRVSHRQLRELFDACTKVIEASELVEGTVHAGTTYDKDHPSGLVNREPGKVIKDATVAEQYLPTQEGFFFGSTEYDEGYLDDVVKTREWIVRMLGDRARGIQGEILYSSWW